MTTCNICKGPMKALLTSWYCPNDCDRKPKQQSSGYQVVERCDGRMWRVAAICAGEVIPAWATKVWWAPYGDFSPDYILHAIRELDRAYGVKWGFENCWAGKTVHYHHKYTYWLLVMAPDD